MKINKKIHLQNKFSQMVVAVATEYIIIILDLENNQIWQAPIVLWHI